MDKLLQIERQWLTLVNSHWTWPFLDQVMLLLSKPWPWILVGVAFLSRQLFWRRNWPFFTMCAVIGVAIILSDAVAYHIFKPLFGRLRPCHELPNIRTIDGCGGQYGFPSNHSVNAFAATLVIYWFQGRFWGSVMLLCSILIGFSRIYLGVHYPSDVIGGFALGALMGALTCVFYERFIAPRLPARLKYPHYN